jgi:hypothetical protein
LTLPSVRIVKSAKKVNAAYLFGAICPARGVGAALALPYADVRPPRSLKRRAWRSASRSRRACRSLADLL